MSKAYQMIQEAQIKFIEEQMELMKNDPTKSFKWIKPWKNGRMPYNYSTKANYRGINLMLLKEGGAWLTFVQAKELGLRIKKGAKSSIVAYYIREDTPNKTKKDKDEEDGCKSSEQEKTKEKLDSKTKSFKKKSYSGYVFHRVFHESDLEDFVNEDYKVEEIVELTSTAKEQKLQKLFLDYTSQENINVSIIQSNSAFYRISEDSIVVPKESQYNVFSEFVATNIHEAIHSTGHINRLKREFGAKFGNEKYSEEELVAEIGTSLMFALYNITEEDTINNSLAYINSWYKVIKEKPNLLISSIRNAQKAVDYMAKYSDVEDLPKGFINEKDDEQ